MNFYIDECMGSHSLLAFLESPTYTTREVQNEETELSDIANIHLCNNNNILPNDPQFNLNMRTSNSMCCIFSQMSSNGSFQGVSSQMGSSNPYLMALVEHCSISELNLKQCKTEQRFVFIPNLQIFKKKKIHCHHLSDGSPCRLSNAYSLYPSLKR